MYKQGLTYTFFKAPSSTWKVTKDFDTKSEHDSYIGDWIKDGYSLISEKPVEKIVEVYPQILKLNLKGNFGAYFTLIERFATSEEYKKYCEYKLLEGYKVIGSEPYFKQEN
jgi:hypothetical protein